VLLAGAALGELRGLPFLDELVGGQGNCGLRITDCGLEEAQAGTARFKTPSPLPSPGGRGWRSGIRAEAGMITDGGGVAKCGRCSAVGRRARLTLGRHAG
jgi:hypothetical protein